MRGIALPPRGSARDEVFRELLRRERSEKAAALQLLTVMFGSALGVPITRIEGMLDLYLLELTQDRYKPAYMNQLRHQRADRLKKKRDDQTLMKKVGKLTVKDSDLPPVKLRGKTHRKR